MSVPLVLLLSTGRFVRYVADDFSTAEVASRLAAAGAMLHWYETWSGRFSFSFLISWWEQGGPGLVRYLPVLVVSVWIGTMTGRCDRSLRLPLLLTRRRFGPRS